MRLCFILFHQSSACNLQILPYSLAAGMPYRYDTFFIAFAQQQNILAAKIYISHRKSHQFGNTATCGIEYSNIA